MKLDIGLYHIHIEDHEIWAEGPDEYVAGDIAEKVRLARGTHEFDAAMESSRRDLVVAEALGIPHRDVQGPASPDDVNEAREFGLPIPKHPSKTQIIRMVNHFQDVRFYLHFVWRNLTGNPPKASGITSGLLNPFVLRLLDEQPALCVRMAFASALANIQGAERECGTDLYRAVAELLEHEFEAYLPREEPEEPAPAAEAVPEAVAGAETHTTSEPADTQSHAEQAAPDEAASPQATQPSEDELIRYACPACGQVLRIPRKHVGMTGRCKYCGNRITIEVSLG